jgi:two-component system phosphate regulon sensor histidine kinase PhoR
VRRAVLRFSWALAGASVLLTAVLVGLYAYLGFSAREKSDVRRAAEYIAAEASARGHAALGDIPTGLAGIRVTLVSGTGEVLFDSASEAGAMDNHLRRPEIERARATGLGEATRFSRTLRERTYYCAVLLGDGTVLRCASSSSSVFAALPGLAAIVACISAAVFAAAAAVGARVTRSLIAPINDLNLDAAENAAYPELAPLLGKLREQRREIESQIVGRERMRREFSANVSHELKTPITAISGYAEILANGVARSEDTRGFAGKIYDEAQRLIALVDDIMLISRLDERGAEFPPERVELLALCREASVRYARGAAARGIVLTVTGEDLTVAGHRRILGEMVGNLIDNAVKYNTDGGSVNVHVGAGEGGVPALTVSDTGVGVSGEDRERVFERFYRADRHRALAPGTGLGLAIVKHAAQLHGAAIELSSDGETGTSVTVTFAREAPSLTT